MGYMNMELPSLMPGAAAIGGGFNPMAAIGGLALEFGSAAYANRLATRRQHEAFDQQQLMYNTRYQNQVKDMMAAGLNPMLAVSQGAPMPGSVGQAQTNKPDMVNAAANLMISSAQAQKTKQETENLKLENQLKQQEVFQFPFSFDKLREEIKNLEQQVKVGKATEDEKRKLIALHEVNAALGKQGLELKRPEAIASGQEGAVVAAGLSRILKPIIDILHGIK